MTDTIEAVIRQLERHSYVVLVPHTNPDADAIGSCLALAHYLKRRGHLTVILTPTAVPNYLQWMPGAADLINASVNLDACRPHLAHAHLIFCMDYGVLGRTKDLEPLIREAPGLKVNIDHHLDATPFADVEFRDVGASSTAELTWLFIRRLQDEYNDYEPLGPVIANSLYAGIATDTGSFRFPSTTPETHRVVAELMEAGANPALVHHQIYNTYSEGRTRFLGYCLYECLRVLPQYNAAYMIVTKEDYDRFKVQNGDTEGLVQFTLAMAGVNLGVLMVEREDRIRMSFRSVGSFPANQLAAHFEGGGHFNAAGGSSYLSVAETEEKLLAKLESYRAQLDYRPFASELEGL